MNDEPRSRDRKTCCLRFWFDFDGDWALLFDLLDREAPPWVQTRNVYHLIDDLRVEHLVASLFTGAQHYALNDEICNKLVFRTEQDK